MFFVNTFSRKFGRSNNNINVTTLQSLKGDIVYSSFRLIYLPSCKSTYYSILESDDSKTEKVKIG